MTSGEGLAPPAIARKNPGAEMETEADVASGGFLRAAFLPVQASAAE